MSSSPVLNPASQSPLLLRDCAVLGPARIGLFENRLTTIRLLPGGVPALMATGETTDFPRMMTLRKAAERENRPTEALWRAMLTSEGLGLSNVGVSIALSMSLGEKNFLVGVRQVRPDFGDSVIKLISGYVNAHSSNPGHRSLGEVVVAAGEVELSEEPVLWNSDQTQAAGGQLLRGLVRSAQSTLNRELVLRGPDGTPFPLVEGPERPLNTPYEGVLPYLPDAHFRIRPATRPLPLPSIFEAIPIEMDGETIYAGLYTSQVFCSAQVVLFYHLELPSDAEALSLSHTENVLDPTSRQLVEQYQRFGAPLLALDESGRITGEIAVLDNGRLTDVTGQSTILSEAFVPCAIIDRVKSGIVEARNISLAEHIKRVRANGAVREA